MLKLARRQGMLRRLVGKGDVAASVAGRLVARGLAIALLVVVARIGGEAFLASFSYLVGLVVLVGGLTEMGTAVIASREVARRDTGLAQAYGAALVPGIVAGALAAVIVLGVGAIDSAPGSHGPALVLAAATLPLTGISGLQSGLLRASGRLAFEATAQVTTSLASTVIAAASLFAGAGLSTLMLSILLRELCLVAVLQCGLPWACRATLRTSFAYVRAGLWMGVASTFLVLTLRLGTMYLGNFSSTQSLALFSIASRWIELGLLLGQSAGVAMLSRVGGAEAEGRGRRESAALPLLAGAYAAVGAIPVIAVMPWLIRLAFGSEFDGATGPSRLIVAGLPFLVAWMVGWYVLAAWRAERVVLGVAAIAACVQVLGLALLSDGASAGQVSLTFVVAVSCAALLTTASLHYLSRRTHSSTQ